MFIYTLFHNICLDVRLRSVHPKTLEIAGSKPLTEEVVLKLSAPEFLQRPAPQPGAPLFGAPRPERPSAPANPGFRPDADPRPTRIRARPGSAPVPDPRPTRIRAPLGSAPDADLCPTRIRARLGSARSVTFSLGSGRPGRCQ